MQGPALDIQVISKQTFNLLIPYVIDIENILVFKMETQSIYKALKDVHILDVRLIS